MQVWHASQPTVPHYARKTKGNPISYLHFQVHCPALTFPRNPDSSTLALIQSQHGKPGGWNKDGLQFSEIDNELKFFVLAGQDAEELPLDIFASNHASILAKLNGANIQLLESRDPPILGRDLAAGVRATESFVESVCRLWEIPMDFHTKVRRPGALPWFSYQVEEESGSDTTKPPRLKALNFCFRWGPGHDGFVILFGRYDVQKATLKAFLSSRTVIGDVTVLDLFNGHSDELLRQPLRLPGLVMGICEFYVDMEAQEINKRSLEVGGILGVRDDWLKGWHIEPCSSLDLNESKAIYAAYGSTNRLNKSCEELISIRKRYLSLIAHLERRCSVNLPREEVEDVVHRAELHGHILKYLERMLRSQFNSYSNLLAREESNHSAAISETSTNIARASYEDSLSMKTISYLTMVFFPITFVSAIFSTSIFDFQQWDTAAANTGVISPGWRVFVLSCSSVTVVTLGVWRLWQIVVKSRRIRRARIADLEKGSKQRQGGMEFGIIVGIACSSLGAYVFAPLPASISSLPVSEISSVPSTVVLDPFKLTLFPATPLSEIPTSRSLGALHGLLPPSAGHAPLCRSYAPELILLISLTVGPNIGSPNAPSSRSTGPLSRGTQAAMMMMISSKRHHNSSGAICQSRSLVRKS